MIAAMMPWPLLFSGYCSWKMNQILDQRAVAARKANMKPEEIEAEEEDGVQVKNETALTSVQSYIATYGGPEYLMHYKYASVIYVIYVTFMYGMLIPIMFPICLLCLINTYITEKISLIWLYRRPPMFDESLGKRAFDLMKRPPYLMFMMGYWAIGNRQIFDGIPAVKVFNNRPGDPKHPLVPAQFNQATLCLIIFLYWLIRAFCYELIYQKIVVPI